MFLPPSKLIGGVGGACPLFLLFFPLKVAPKETFVIYFLLFHINTEWKCGSIIMSGVVWGQGGGEDKGQNVFAPHPLQTYWGVGVAPSSSYSFF